jgi:hypothetical protein
MKTSKFEQSLATILAEAQQPAQQEKLASLENRLENINGDVARSLTKLASLVREVSVEPTYNDLIRYIREGN